MKELFPLNTPDCISSQKRKPLFGKNITYERPMICDENDNEYNNPMIKWYNRGTIGAFRATENLVSDPENQTTSNWSEEGSSASLSGLYWKGRRFTKLTGLGTLPYCRVRQNFTITAGVNYAITITFRRGYSSLGDTYNNFKVEFYASGDNARLNVPWDKSGATIGSQGTIISEKWYGDVVEVKFIAHTTSATSIGLYCSVIYTEDAGVKVPTDSYGYLTAIQMEKMDYPTPYTPTSRDIGALIYAFEWSQQGTIECWVRPWFTYDVTANKYIFSNYDGGSSDVQILLRYDVSRDKWNFYLSDGSNNVSMISSQITSNTDLWKWWHFKVTWDTENDDYYFYIDGVSVGDTTATVNAVTFNNNLSISSIPRYTSPSPHVFDGLITDLLYKDYVDTSVEHYEKNIPYRNKTEILGEDTSWKII